jgi:hypothetical protein
MGTQTRHHSGGNGGTAGCLNFVVLAAKGSKITIIGGMISGSGSGANGAFAAGSGVEVSLTNTKIKAAGGGHGVMATLGGSVTMKDVDITTSHERTGQSHPVGGAAGKMVVQFLVTASDRFHAQPVDEGCEPIAAMPELLGLQGHRPAALLLVQTA